MPYADQERNRASVRDYHRAHPDEVRENRRRERMKLKYEVLVAYSGLVPSCACCREDHVEFLTLDHINGGGNEARRNEGHKGGTQQYRKLRREGFPTGYRILCFNCNHAYGAYGYCPHPEDKPLKQPRATVFAVVR